MFLADDVVMFPFKSLFRVFKEIYKAAQQEIAAEADSIRNELSQLYLALEAGTISEEAFDAHERDLLDRLDAIEEQRQLDAAGGSDSDDDDQEDEEDVDDDEDAEDDDENENDDDDSVDEEEEVRDRGEYLYERSPDDDEALQ